MEVYEKMGYSLTKTFGVNHMKPDNYILFITLAMVMGIVVLWQIDEQCQRYRSDKTIKIGFSGCLTGHLSDLGINGRDGVILATEEINAKKGISGKKIELIIKDDKNDPAIAVKADKVLVSSGCIAIIGHMTSSMSVAAVPYINTTKTIMISPTTSTDKLEGIDDNFFRVISSNKMESEIIATYARNKLGVEKVVCLYDIGNKDFSESWLKNFEHFLKKTKKDVLYKLKFNSKNKISYLDIAKRLIGFETDGICIIAGAIHTAMICQQIRKMGYNIPIISSGWAASPELIKYGGSAVEGLIFPQVFNKNSKNPMYLDFRKNFKKRFGRGVSFAAVCGYEAAKFVFMALSLPDKFSNIKKAMLKLEKFEGLQGEIFVDKYGDAKRDQFIITIKDGEFKTLETMK